MEKLSFEMLTSESIKSCASSLRWLSERRKMVIVKKALVSLNLIGPVIPNAEKMLLIGLKSKQTWWLMPQVQQNKNNSFFEGLSVRGAYYPKVLNAPVYPLSALVNRKSACFKLFGWDGILNRNSAIAMEPEKNATFSALV